jgi:type II secretory pathway component PulM
MPRTREGVRKTRISKRRRPALWRRAAYSSMRLGMWSLAVLLLALFCNKVWHPYGLNRKLQKDLVESRAQLEAVRQDNARQLRRIEYLHTPQGQAAEARRLGYHFPGEVHRLQVPPPPAQPAPTETGR